MDGRGAGPYIMFGSTSSGPPFSVSLVKLLVTGHGGGGKGRSCVLIPALVVMAKVGASSSGALYRRSDRISKGKGHCRCLPRIMLGPVSLLVFVGLVVLHLKWRKCSWVVTRHPTDHLDIGHILQFDSTLHLRIVEGGCLIIKEVSSGYGKRFVLRGGIVKQQMYAVAMLLEDQPTPFFEVLRFFAGKVVTRRDDVTYGGVDDMLEFYSEESLRSKLLPLQQDIWVKEEENIRRMMMMKKIDGLNNEKGKRKWQSMVLEIKIEEIVCSKKEVLARV
ncbi:hypothetical protein Tco_1028912 [Tanacetum coccineum]|uniref:Uncharacterized protein n=1 Tax=Tanacetum coccineum TaxID=301880 RepID=A0ABQ5G289_9ASTR